MNFERCSELLKSSCIVVRIGHEVLLSGRLVQVKYTRGETGLLTESRECLLQNTGP